MPENKKFNRDASAAAIMVCAFQLLYKQTGDYFFAAGVGLRSVSDYYLLVLRKLEKDSYQQKG